MLVACLLVAPVTRVRSDWIALHDGRTLRGIDLKSIGEHYWFILEDGESFFFPVSELHYFEASPVDERVEFRGRTVPLEKKVRALVREAHERDRERLDLTERWVRSKGIGSEGDASDLAREKLESLDSDEFTRAMADALRRSRWANVRELAVDKLEDRLARAGKPGAPGPRVVIGGERIELRESTERRAMFALARTAVADEYSRLRERALLAFAKVGHDDTALYIAPFLASHAREARTRAAYALAAFPDRRVAEQLVDTLHMAWTGFGKAFTLQGTQRAYIADYELVSGGTGFSLLEVADPVVRTMQTGVVLEADVERVELYARLRALEKISGQNFGKDVDRWKRWLAENPAKP